MRVLAIFAFSFAAAIVVTMLGLSQTAALIAAGVLAAAGLAGLCVRRAAGKRLAVLCFGLAMGLVWVPVYRLAVIAPGQALCGDSVSLRATLLDYPTESSYGSYVQARLSDGDTQARAIVYLDEEALELEPGAVLTLTAQVYTAEEAGNTYYPSVGVFLLATAEEYDVMSHSSVAFRYWPVRLKHTIQQRIDTLFSASTAPLLKALLTGEKSDLSDETISDLKTAGVYHAVAVSGMHVSVLVGFLGLLIRRKRQRALVGIPVVLLFMIMIGSAPGVTRASVMQLILLSAALLRREYDSPTALGAAALLLLGLNPWAITNVGFQLSFASTAGILLFSTRLYRALGSNDFVEKIEKRLPLTKPTGNPVLNFLAASVATSLGALVFSTPILAYQFGGISIISVLSNLLLLWAVTWCFAGGLVAVLLPGILGKAAAWACMWPARYFLWGARVLAKIPFASVSVSSPYILAWLVFAYLVILALVFGKGRKRPLVPLCAVTATLCVCLLLSAAGYTASSWSVSVLDVGQGQCVALYAGGGNVMVDCGGDDNPGDTAAQFLSANGQLRLDALVLTHFDSDHVGGVAALLRQVEVGVIYVPETEDDSGNREEILLAAQASGVPVYNVTQDVSLQMGDGVLQIFAPTGAGADNESGLAVLFSCGQFDALITGDMNQSGEARLLAAHTLPDIELLVAGHHGSKSSTGQALLDALKPEIAAISVGENSYGHPARETLARLEAAGAEIYRTDQCGTITVRR